MKNGCVTINLGGSDCEEAWVGCTLMPMEAIKHPLLPLPRNTRTSNSIRLVQKQLTKNNK